MIKYAIDSNIISYLLKGNEQIAERIEAETSIGHEVVIPPIAYYEVKRGLIASSATAKIEIFNNLCSENKVGDIDRATLDAAATIYASLRLIGRSIEDADILIAAFCIANDFTLITNNTKHFEHINGLSFMNWIDDKIF
jgi:predicted nucleic acid-binding protein